jgi:hypothetical protein
MRESIGDKGFLSDDNRKEIIFSENGIIYKGINKNKKRVLRYQVDGGIFNDDQKKCDKAFGLPEIRDFYLVELKGKNLRHASDQIYETIKALGEKIKSFRVHGRVVCSRIPRPDLRSSQIVKLERELAKRGGRLIKQSRILEEVI